MAEYSRFWEGTILGDAGPYTADDQWEIDRHINIDSDEFDERGPIAGAEEELQVVPSAPVAMSVVVEPGAGLCYGGWYFNTTDLTLPIAANAGPGIRWDVVVLRANWATQTIRAAIVQGIQGAGPPGLTRVAGTTWEIRIALVEIAAAAPNITAADINDFRNFVNPREIFLGLADFETDLGANTATITAFGATTSRGWELTNGTTEKIYATVMVPLDWGDSPLTCTLHVWGYAAGVQAAILDIDRLAIDSGDAPANLVAWGNATHPAAGIYRILCDATITVTPGQLLEIAIAQNNTATSYWLLGVELDVRRN